MGQRDRLNNLIHELDIKTIGKWFIYSTMIGIIAGLGSSLFYYMLESGTNLFLNYMADYHPPLPGGESGDSVAYIKTSPNWILGILPTVGGLIAGIIVYKWAPEAGGHGTDAVIDSFHRLRGIVRKRVPVVKSIASAITIGTGGSAGREGPVAQIGAGFGSYLASLLKLSDRERRLMVIAGAGGGVGSMFRAPLGGALFATEVLYREPEFEFEGIIPAIISPITAGCFIFTNKNPRTRAKIRAIAIKNKTLKNSSVYINLLHPQVLDDIA